MSDYSYRIVFCSEERGRAYREKILYTQTHAVVASVEALPPGYELAMARMRDLDEEVLLLSSSLTWDMSKQQCPFCGNRNTFACSCGMISCMSRDKDIHECPNPECSFIGTCVKSAYIPVSPSGFARPERLQFPQRSTPSVSPSLPRITSDFFEKARERREKLEALKKNRPQRRIAGLLGWKRSDPDTD